jgi:uncharacterized protein with PQ loop repeat
MIKIIGIIAAVILPFWNIPLIVRIEKRKSSRDISLFWVFGVWVCFIFMLPSALSSQDIVFKLFSIVNILLFSLVLVETLRFR